MMSRSRRYVALVMAVLASSFAVPACGEPAATWTGVERIVAVGDVHGDYAQVVKALKAAGVIDDKENWAAGKTHLVQTGDLLEKGAAARKCLDLLMKLEKQSADAGGAVHALIGNHEATVLMGDWQYTTKEDIDAFGGQKSFVQAMSAQGKYGKWIRAHNVVIKINDMLFVHGGITPAYAGKSIVEINKAVRDELVKGEWKDVAGDPDGPLWDRSLAIDDEGTVAKDLDKVLKAFDARHMVVGHTADTDGIQTRADGRLIRIDVGMTEIYGGPAACLIVENGVFYEARHGKDKPIIKKLLGDTAASRPAATQPSSQRASFAEAAGVAG